MSSKLFSTIFLFMALQVRLITALECLHGTRSTKVENRTCDGFCSVDFRFKVKHKLSDPEYGCAPQSPSCTHSAEGVACTCADELCNERHSTDLERMANRVWTDRKDIPTTVCKTTSGQQFCSFPGQFCTARFQLKASVTAPEITCTYEKYPDRCKEEKENAFCNCKNGIKCVKSGRVKRNRRGKAQKSANKPTPSTSTTTSSTTTTTTTTTTTAEPTSHAKTTPMTTHSEASQIESSPLEESPQTSDAPPVENNSDTNMWIAVAVIVSAAFFSAGAVTIYALHLRQKRAQAVVKPAAAPKRRPLADETKVETTQGTEDTRQTTSFSQIIGDTTTHDAFA